MLGQSDGGQVLLESLMDDLVMAVDTIATQTETLTHLQFIDFGGRIRERLVLIRQIMGAEPEADILKQVLKEELEREKAEAAASAKPENGMTDLSGA